MYLFALNFQIELKLNELSPSLWPSGIGLPLGTEQDVSSIPGSVGFYPMSI